MFYSMANIKKKINEKMKFDKKQKAALLAAFLT
jgi:hypothetical protein